MNISGLGVDTSAPITRSLVNEWLPKDLANIVLQYFVSPRFNREIWNKSPEGLEYESMYELLNDPWFRAIDRFAIIKIMAHDRRESHYPQYLFNNGEYETCLQVQNISDMSLHVPCRNGYIEIVKLMISHGAKHWNSGLYGACAGGNMEIANLMIYHGANKWNKCLKAACLNNQIELADLMISRGATNLDDCLIEVCARGGTQIASFLVSKGAKTTLGLDLACSSGDIALVNLLISTGANDWNHALSAACESGHLEIVKLLISHGANDWTHAIFCARKSGNKELVDYLVAIKSKK